MKFQVVIITALIIIVSVKAQANNDLGTYCGGVLADTMAVICKWDNEAYEEDKRTAGNGIKYRHNKFGWFGPRAYHAYSGMKTKRGIVEECCDQPCDISTLLSYC